MQTFDESAQATSGSILRGKIALLGAVGVFLLSTMVAILCARALLVHEQVPSDNRQELRSLERLISVQQPLVELDVATREISLERPHSLELLGQRFAALDFVVTGQGLLTEPTTTRVTDPVKDRVGSELNLRYAALEAAVERMVEYHEPALEFAQSLTTARRLTTDLAVQADSFLARALELNVEIEHIKLASQQLAIAHQLATGLVSSSNVNVDPTARLDELGRRAISLGDLNTRLRTEPAGPTAARIDNAQLLSMLNEIGRLFRQAASEFGKLSKSRTLNDALLDAQLELQHRLGEFSGVLVTYDQRSDEGTRPTGAGSSPELVENTADGSGNSSRDNPRARSGDSALEQWYRELSTWTQQTLLIVALIGALASFVFLIGQLFWSRLRDQRSRIEAQTIKREADERDRRRSEGLQEAAKLLREVSDPQGARLRERSLEAALRPLEAEQQAALAVADFSRVAQEASASHKQLNQQVEDLKEQEGELRTTVDQARLIFERSNDLQRTTSRATYSAAASVEALDKILNEYHNLSAEAGGDLVVMADSSLKIRHEITDAKRMLAESSASTQAVERILSQFNATRQSMLEVQETARLFAVNVALMLEDDEPAQHDAMLREAERIADEAAKTVEHLGAVHNRLAGDLNQSRSLSQQVTDLVDASASELKLLGEGLERAIRTHERFRVTGMSQQRALHEHMLDIGEVVRSMRALNDSSQHIEQLFGLKAGTALESIVDQPAAMRLLEAAQQSAGLETTLVAESQPAASIEKVAVDDVSDEIVSEADTSEKDGPALASMTVDESTTR